ncbi:ACP S-malonyltransferase [Elusimicrobiota bacterium]
MLSSSKGIAFLFPGHSVRVGMGRSWAEISSSARGIIERADDVLGYSLSRIAAEGPLEELQRTRYAQPATLTAGIAACEALKERGILPALVAGRSVGEFTAAVAAGVLDFGEALAVVAQRGRDFETDCGCRPGAMVSLHDITRERAEGLCREVRESLNETCCVAGLNSPHRITISGTPGAIAEVSRLAAAAGAEVLPLRVSGAFHSELMAGAAAALERRCRDLTFRDPRVPMATGVDGRLHSEGARIRDNILSQVTRPVLWEDVIRALVDRGAETFVEIGPRQGLAHMAKETAPAKRAVTVEDEASLGELEDLLASAGTA